MGPTPSYQPHVVENFAARLEARARSVARGATVFGSCAGGVLGAAPLLPVETVWHLPPTFGGATTLGGLLVGALVGRVVGTRRAYVHHLHAQTILSQLHAQRATLAIWRLLRSQEQEQAQREEPLPGVTPLPERVEPGPPPSVPISHETPFVVTREPEPEPRPTRQVAQVPLVSVQSSAVVPPVAAPPPPVAPPAATVEPVALQAVPFEPRPEPPRAIENAGPPQTRPPSVEQVEPLVAQPLLHAVAPVTPVGAVFTVQPEVPAPSVHQLFTPQPHDHHEPTHAEERAPEPPQAVPSPPAMPRSLDPWVAPPLAPPASGS